MPSDQLAKFAYSPLGKAFEKQTKTIEDQGEKQIQTIEDNKKQLDNEQQQGNNDYRDLKFTVNSSGLEIDFSELKDPVAFLDSVEKR